jgi:hypothetical protein
VVFRVLSRFSTGMPIDTAYQGNELSNILSNETITRSLRHTLSHLRF